MAATIKDVAAAAGVSPSTVSRAFTRPEKVETSTRHRILELATELHYHPNRAARSLIAVKTGAIGVILPDLNNPFFAGILKGIQIAAEGLGYQVLLADTDEDIRREQAATATLAAQVDGLILCSPRLEDADIIEYDKRLPVVLINRRVQGVPSAHFDNAGGMRQALLHLQALGHRKIGYVGAPLASRSARERLAAFSAPGIDDLQTTYVGEFFPSFEGGSLAADETLNTDLTAVVVYNDVMAIGLLHRLLSYGMVIPQRLSIVSFDDVPIASMISPPLTTVSLARDQAGRAAAQMLGALLSPTGQTDLALEIPTALLVRGSSGICD